MAVVSVDFVFMPICPDIEDAAIKVDASLVAHVSFETQGQIVLEPAKDIAGDHGGPPRVLVLQHGNNTS
jgi:hypothetical protein